MSVWVVLFSIPYSSDTVAGVFATEELAGAFVAGKDYNPGGAFGEYVIEEHPLVVEVPLEV